MADVPQVVTEIVPATGGGVAGSILTLLGIWLKTKMYGNPSERSAERAHEELDQVHEELDLVKERLARIETSMLAMSEADRRNETAVAVIDGKLTAMSQSLGTQMGQTMSNLARIEGELRGRRERD